MHARHPRRYLPTVASFALLATIAATDRVALAQQPASSPPAAQPAEGSAERADVAPQRASSPLVPTDSRGNAWPDRIKYSDGDVVPAGYHLDTHVRKGLVIAGSVTFGAVYALNVAIAGAATGDGKFLYVPLAGPLVIAAGIKSSAAYGLGAIAQIFLVLDSLIQIGGVTMLAVGVAAPKTELVRNDIGKLQVSPVVSPSYAGVGMGGQF